MATDRGRAVGLDPEPGLYKTRLVQGGPWVPAAIWYGAPLDPETREPLDRPFGMQCLIAGELCDPHDRWPMHPVMFPEWERLMAAMPDEPREARDMASLPPLFAKRL